MKFSAAHLMNEIDKSLRQVIRLVGPNGCKVWILYMCAVACQHMQAKQEELHLISHEGLVMPNLNILIVKVC